MASALQEFYEITGRCVPQYITRESQDIGTRRAWLPKPAFITQTVDTLHYASSSKLHGKTRKSTDVG